MDLFQEAPSHLPRRPRLSLHQRCSSIFPMTSLISSDKSMAGLAVYTCPCLRVLCSFNSVLHVSHVKPFRRFARGKWMIHEADVPGRQGRWVWRSRAYDQRLNKLETSRGRGRYWWIVHMLKAKAHVLSCARLDLHTVDANATACWSWLMPGWHLMSTPQE